MIAPPEPALALRPRLVVVLDWRGGWLWLRDSSLVAVARRADHRRHRVRRRAGAGRARDRGAGHDHAARARGGPARRDRAVHARSTTCSVAGRLPAHADDPGDRAPSRSPRSPARGERRDPGHRQRRRCCAASPPSATCRASTLERTRPARASPTASSLRALAVASAAPDAAAAAAPSEVEVDKRGVIVDARGRPRTGLRRRRRGATRNGSRRPACWPRPRPQGATYLDLRIPGSGGRRRARADRSRRRRDPNPQPEAENSPTLDP